MFGFHRQGERPPGSDRNGLHIGLSDASSANSSTGDLTSFATFCELQPEDKVAPGFSVRIEVEGAVHAALERVLHDEVQSVKMFDDVTPHLAANEVREG